MSLSRLFCLLFLSLPARSSTVRLDVEAAQDVPLKKTAAIGALLGARVSGDFVDALPRKAFGTPGERAADPRGGDAYEGVRLLLTDIFGEASMLDEASIRNFLTDLRRSGTFDTEGVRALGARLSSSDSKGFEHVVVRDIAGRQGLEQLYILEENGKCSFMIGRYSACKNRSAAEVIGLRAMLWSVDNSREHEDLFVRYFASSHTAAEFDSDPSADVLVLIETYFGNLEEAFNAIEVNLQGRMQMFLDAALAVEQTNRWNIPHRSDISPENILVMVPDDNDEPLAIRLNPIIIVAEPALSPHDTWNSDVRQLGSLLRFLFSGAYPHDVQPIANVLLAFGKAIEFGLLPGDETATSAIADLLERVSSPDVTFDELMGMRLDYLGFARDAAHATAAKT